MEQSGWNEVTMERTDRIKPYKKNFKYNASKFAQINIYVWFSLSGFLATYTHVSLDVKIAKHNLETDENASL